MEQFVIKAKSREVIGKQVRALRREGLLPAIVYGHHIQPISISMDYREATRVLQGVSSSQLIDVELEGERHTTLVREKQHHPVTGALLHIDFLEVSMTEKLRASVRIHFEGESFAVKNYSGVIVAGQEEIEVECLPSDLPSKIVVDLSVLKEIGDSLYVRDLVLPPEVEILTDLNELVVIVTAQAAEAEVEAVEAVVGAEEPEVMERGKKEEEEED